MVSIFPICSNVVAVVIVCSVVFRPNNTKETVDCSYAPLSPFRLPVYIRFYVSLNVKHQHSFSNHCLSVKYYLLFGGCCYILRSLSIRETPKTKSTVLEAAESTSSSTALALASSAVCPWDEPDEPAEPTVPAQVKLSVCPWELDSAPEPPAAATAGTATAMGTGASKSSCSAAQPLRLNR